ncbi:putative squalene monooxygenase [Rosa chinensis]|uniref:Squalene monooxygenase n=1 Tax=Rosa chinensis TaxID=74649 RepID=A0A2P6P9P4_ROSCH|nr:putative squalene monooxygenase [Rosa chinensis]
MLKSYLCIFSAKVLSEPDRIVGELLQPGGYLKLIELGLEDCAMSRLMPRKCLVMLFTKMGRIQHCLIPWRLGGICSYGPVSLLSGLNPRPLHLFLHLFAAAIYGVGRLMLPFPSPKRMWLGFLLILVCQRNYLHFFLVFTFVNYV